MLAPATDMAVLRAVGELATLVPVPPSRRSRLPILVTLIVLLAACDGRAGSPVPSSSTATRSATSSAAPSFDDPIDVAFDRSGGMWIGNYQSSTLFGYRPSVLRAASGEASIEPSVTLTDLGGPNQLAFAADGVLWVAAYDDDAIRGYQPAALSTSGRAKASVSITGRQLASPTDLAFDDRGWLWVANQGNGRVVAYAPAQLRASGRPEPRLVLTPFPGEQQPPLALAFSPGGWLWVSDYDLDVVEAFDRSQLQRTGVPRPSQRLQLEQLAGPIGLTFDGRGRLWIAEATLGQIEVFSQDVPAVPHRDATLHGDDLQMPHSVTFAPDGSIWIPCYNGTVLRYAAGAESDRGAGPSLILM
jgi:sugar lactone lactonase YvrE